MAQISVMAAYLVVVQNAVGAVDCLLRHDYFRAQQRLINRKSSDTDRGSEAVRR
jgi:hypothetical protein